jgi:hypothetical protein
MGNIEKNAVNIVDDYSELKNEDEVAAEKTSNNEVADQ